MIGSFVFGVALGMFMACLCVAAKDDEDDLG